MNSLRHVMILASAGSGKTYALTNRFVQLLALGAAPEKIAALTFTRKAAGEFFDEILNKLAKASVDAAAAATLAREIGQPSFTCADFLRMLRTTIAAMHRLQLGTLDGFFARVVRAFPLELGLGGDFEVLQEHAAQIERRRVLRRMFSARASGSAIGAGETASADARLDFIEAFKRATFGVEEKQLGARLDEFLDAHAEAYLAAPVADLWGRAERIWPCGCEWFDHCDAKRRSEAARLLEQALPWPQFSEKQSQRWRDFLAGLPAWSAGAPLPKPVQYLLTNVLDAWPDLKEIVVERKKVSLPPAAIAALRAVACGIIGAELTRRLEMTQGMFSVLHGYEAVYDAAVRRAGRLTFADVQRILRPLTRDTDADPGARLFIDWRLDAQIDHWLLDEFQDTSYGQWSVLENLIDEVVQDAGGRRSFFYVGDVKQAIYAWREGDPRLFREIFDRYNAGGQDIIEERRLDESYRSGPAVIEMVNRVFGDVVAMRALFPGEAVERWSREWRPHHSARPELGGYAGLRHAPDEAGRFAATLQVIFDTGALERGLSVAVLVQKNETASMLADYLRREGGIQAVAEADRHIATDNPFTAALLALCRAAAHPGDRAAQEHLAMTPLASGQRPMPDAARAANFERRTALFDLTADQLSENFLRDVHRHGFEGALRARVAEMETALRPDDTFSRQRGRQFLAAARLFDETGSRDVSEFVQFMERHTVREVEEVGVVRVMTVHKAKGLGFDVVILPDLEGTRIASRRRSLAMQRAKDRSLEWILDLPPALFHAHDPILSAHVAAAEADACYEAFAVLYVAMTRAKRAMYVITEPVGTSKSHNFPRLLQDTLGEEWSAGDPAWYRGVPVAPAEPVGGGIIPNLSENEIGAAAQRRTVQRPSSAGAPRRRASDVFDLHGADARDRGRAVHELLAEVEWIGPGDSERIAQEWRAGGLGFDGAGLLRAALWTRPKAAAVDVWRERPFEILLDGEWVSGVFDRVVVERDANGRPSRAAVYDFKTDAVEDRDAAEAARKHSHQLNLYRRVVAILTGLTPDRVQAFVVFTSGAVVRCGGD